MTKKKNYILNLIDYILDLSTSRLLLAFKNNGYLVETGWLQSYKKKSPINANGEAIPWTTYSYIKFIEKYLNKSMNMFEFGSGNSTIYYSKKVKTLTSVENNHEWHSRLINEINKNVTLLLEENENEYTESILKTNSIYDVIVIDGRYRNKCIEKSIKCISENGIIVLDDSEREKYSSGISLLLKNSFHQLDFWGISPGYFHDKCTSVFYKNSLIP